MGSDTIDPMAEHINWHWSRLDKNESDGVTVWIAEYHRSFGHFPSLTELKEYVENVYYWHIANTLIQSFSTQKYGGNYIFSYASWNCDKPVTQVYLESEFRRYLRLFWQGKIGVIPCSPP
jgi:hypothetical protein